MSKNPFQSQVQLILNRIIYNKKTKHSTLILFLGKLVDINWLLIVIYNLLCFKALTYKKDCFLFIGDYEHRKTKKLQTVNCMHL